MPKRWIHDGDGRLRLRTLGMGALVMVLLAALVVWSLAGHGSRTGAHTVAQQASPALVTATAVPSPTVTVSPAPAVSADSPPAAAGPVPPPPAVQVAANSTVVYLNGPATVQVYGAADAGRPLEQLPGHNTIAQPAAFLVINASVPGWYQVLLPVKPNGTSGWIRASDVQVATTQSYLLVSLSRFALYHYEGGRLVGSMRVAIGRPSTPTPTGLFYVWASQAVGSAPYDPGIFALSGYTAQPVPGFLGARLGLHGWTDPSVIGQPVSNGCVRLRSADMGPLLNNLILGTPVQIVS